MKKIFLSASLLLSLYAFADSSMESPEPAQPKPCLNPHGWSFDIGGLYTWMSFTTPPTFKGSTGGVIGKVTYQEPKSFYGQLRSIYNSGSLSSSQANSNDNEWYTEFVAGYTFCALPSWTITPYAGVGLDYLNDDKKAYSTVAAINLHYRTNYSIFGFDTQYSWSCYYLGVQAECLPVFNQYLSIGGLSGASWKMDSKVGMAVRIPIGFKFSNHIWLELAPYYRLLPIGKSSVLSLPSRSLNQWGGAFALRFFI